MDSERRPRPAGLKGDAFFASANRGVKGLLGFRKVVLSVGVTGLVGMPLFCLSTGIMEHAVTPETAGWVI